MPSLHRTEPYARPQSRLVLVCVLPLTLVAIGCGDPECPPGRTRVGTACLRTGVPDGGSDGPVAELGVDASRMTVDAQVHDAVAPLDTGTSTNASDDASTQAADRALPACLAETEVCDGKDNDCDGMIDEGVANACGGCEPIEASHAPDQACSNGGQGICAKPGSWQCRGGTTVCSAPDPTPSAEICDGKDNDCDGVADNGITKNSCGGCSALPHAKNEPCDNGLKGECAATGVYVCSVDAESVSCSAPQKTGTAETCDGKDNDCNGQIDDNVTGASRWYRDCDGDTFAASQDGSVLACAKPASSGTCSGWTDRAPGALSSTDCDDYSPAYHPGADYGLPTGANQSGDLNCDGKSEALATVTAEDMTELALCAYPSSCDCYALYTRNGMVASDWISWRQNATSPTFHPAIACSSGTDDKLTIARFTSGADKAVAGPGCAYSVTSMNGNSSINTKLAHQRCR